MVLQQIAARWWMLALRGCAALFFGLFLMAPQGVNVYIIVPVFAWYAIADGIVLVALSDLGGEYWWAALLNGVASIFAGAGILLAKVEPFPLVNLIIAWAIARGVLEIAAALRLRDVPRYAWMMILAGVLSLGYGAMLLSSSIRFSGNFLISAFVETVWTALYACALGLALLLLAILLRSARLVRSTVGNRDSTVTLR